MNTPINQSSSRRDYETKRTLLVDALSEADSSRSSVPLLAKFFEGRKYEYIYEKSDGEIALFSDFPSTSIYNRITSCIKRIFSFNDSSKRDMTLKKLSFSQIKTKVEKELDDQTLGIEIRNEIAEKFRALIGRFELKPMSLFAYLFYPVSTEKMKISRIKQADEARAMVDRFTNPIDNRDSDSDLSKHNPKNFRTPPTDSAINMSRSILSKKTGRGESTPAKQVTFISPISGAATPPAHPYGSGAMSGLNTAAKRELKELEKNLREEKQDPWGSLLYSPVSASGSPTNLRDPDLNASSLWEDSSQILDITGFNQSAANTSRRDDTGDFNETAGDLSLYLRNMCTEFEKITGKPISSTS